MTRQRPQVPDPSADAIKTRRERFLAKMRWICQGVGLGLGGLAMVVKPTVAFAVGHANASYAHNAVTDFAVSEHALAAGEECPEAQDAFRTVKSNLEDQFSRSLNGYVLAVMSKDDQVNLAADVEVAQKLVEERQHYQSACAVEKGEEPLPFGEGPAEMPVGIVELGPAFADRLKDLGDYAEATAEELRKQSASRQQARIVRIGPRSQPDPGRITRRGNRPDPHTR